MLQAAVCREQQVVQQGLVSSGEPSNNDITQIHTSSRVTNAITARQGEVEN